VATVQCILIPLIARSVDGVMDVHGCSGHYSIIREGKQAVVGVRIPRGARRLEGACGLRWRRRPIHDWMKEDDKGKKTEAYVDRLHVERIRIMMLSDPSIYRYRD
jgi:hypothetical protein